MSFDKINTTTETTEQSPFRHWKKKKGEINIGITEYAFTNHLEGTRGSCLTGPNAISRLLALCTENFDKAIPGYRDGVIEIPVPSEGFVSAVRILQSGDQLVGSYTSRYGDETPRKIISVVGEKSPAKSVSIILYRSDVLAEDGDNSLPSSTTNWEIVMINASPIDRPLNMNPLTLLANHFQDDGGTSTKMTAEELVEQLRESYWDWRDKAIVNND